MENNLSFLLEEMNLSGVQLQVVQAINTALTPLFLELAMKMGAYDADFRSPGLNAEQRQALFTRIARVGESLLDGLLSQEGNGSDESQLLNDIHYLYELAGFVIENHTRAVRGISRELRTTQDDAAIDKLLYQLQSSTDRIRSYQIVQSAIRVLVPGLLEI